MEESVWKKFWKCSKTALKLLWKNVEILNDFQAI